MLFADDFLSNFDTSKVTSMEGMFSNCVNLQTIYVSESWSTGAVGNAFNMFNGCTSLVGGIVYDETKLDVTYANYTSGYFTYKAKA